MARKQLGMVIDTARCIGCHTCSVACKVENNLPDGVWWNRVLTDGGEAMDTPSGQYPHLDQQYLTVACQHCENPPCVQVCPVGATWKDEETGIVMQDPEKCIGCRYCVVACPYTGVRQFAFAEPEFANPHPMGAAAAQVHQKGTVSKCTLCAHRVAEGETPACIDSCPARARHFGDLNDPESEVSQLLRERDSFQLLPEKGTRPSVHFLS